MTMAINKYDILIKAKIWNSVYPEQDKTAKITSVVNNLKENNLDLAKYIK